MQIAIIDIGSWLMYKRNFECALQKNIEGEKEKEETRQGQFINTQSQ
jgi:hypothetical protein